MFRLLKTLCTFTLTILGLYFALVPAIGAASVKMKSIKYGTSPLGHPLSANFFYNNKVKQNKLIILTEGVHGNEYTGIVNLLSAYLKTTNNLPSGFKHFFNHGGVLLSVPKLNVDGVFKGNRYNNEGMDLNRSFTENKLSSSQQSLQFTRFLKLFIQRSKIQPIFAVDYHCCGSAALIPSSASVNSEVYKAIDKTLKASLGPNFKTVNTKELFGKTYKGTLKDYLHNTYKIAAITFEATDLVEYTRSDQHLNWWDKLSAYFSNASPSLDASSRDMVATSLDQYNFKKSYSE